ncbi:hypothetical protein ACFX59_02485 [Sphingomonas sp. NCPPB 2930]|uniref:hypothetical protein n=1 Tax=Sphingomonas sp. NCPPB 2930 TaxID=3162788 RepID=UPI0036D7D24F
MISALLLAAAAFYVGFHEFHVPTARGSPDTGMITIVRAQDSSTSSAAPVPTPAVSPEKAGAWQPIPLPTGTPAPSLPSPEFLTREDVDFNNQPPNKILEASFREIFSRILRENSYLKRDPPPDITCRGDRCRITGEVANDASVENSNSALDLLRSAFSGDTSENGRFSGDSNYYYSENGRSYFQSYLIPKK